MDREKALIAQAAYEDGIRAALKIAQAWDFTPHETVAMLGLMAHMAESPDVLETFCISAASRDIQSRCSMIIDIHDRLSRKYGEHTSTVLSQQRQSFADKRSPKQLIASGDYWSLHFLWLCGNTLMSA